MIKLFRNIRQSLLMENKTSKYLKYAIGEVVLVVIGILIALSINNWNTQRQYDHQEQSILSVLKSEFIYNQLELNRNIDKATRLKNRVDSLIALFKNPNDIIDTVKLRKLSLGLSAYSTYDPSNGALTNLISSGQLNLVKNDNLRLILSKWFGEVQDVKEDEIRLMNFGDTYLDPIKLKSLNYSADSKFDRNIFSLLNNPEFENVVVRMSSAVNYIIQNYNLLGLEIEKILMLIEQEIKIKNLKHKSG